ncbi:hypothetical protein [Bacillus cereus group sp. TH152-1LC]|uniref:hypothetical protein n=1 Tax=Bacillus cereus group sp. TH152-1LC TaxID=3018060 RepID=UPI0022E2F964|nr:hypothetical protein [Bacillus cereus group sp. TH152-1LC]MDA1675661.1 hypothetical protein [Bacillus cereus group sp. TH152-1LC]
MEEKILLYAKRYVQGQIVRIEIDLSLDIYGEEPTKKLKEKLLEWKSELKEINQKIAHSENI